MLSSELVLAGRWCDNTSDGCQHAFVRGTCCSLTLRKRRPVAVKPSLQPRAEWVTTFTSKAFSCCGVTPAAGAGLRSPASASHRSDCVASALTLVPKAVISCRQQLLAKAQQSDQQSARADHVRNGSCVPPPKLQTPDAVTDAMCESDMRIMRCKVCNATLQGALLPDRGHEHCRRHPAHSRAAHMHSGMVRSLSTYM